MGIINLAGIIAVDFRGNLEDFLGGIIGGIIGDFLGDLIAMFCIFYI